MALIEGLKNAIAAVGPGTSWQRCRTHALTKCSPRCPSPHRGRGGGPISDGRWTCAAPNGPVQVQPPGSLRPCSRHRNPAASAHIEGTPPTQLPPPYGGDVHILFVCTANRCRSPMAEVLLASRLASIEATETVVSSAGFLPPGFPATPETIKAMEPYGLDLSAHRSRRLSIDDVLTADLILGLDRRHAREIVLLNSEAWPYTFTLPELVRRGEQVGPRRLTVTGGEWVLEAQNGRQRAELVGRSAEDEVADPSGGPPARVHGDGSVPRQPRGSSGRSAVPISVRRRSLGSGRIPARSKSRLTSLTLGKAKRRARTLGLGSIGCISGSSGRVPDTLPCVSFRGARWKKSPGIASAGAIW